MIQFGDPHANDAIIAAFPLILHPFPDDLKLSGSWAC
jgi:hypothetical protein